MSASWIDAQDDGERIAHALRIHGSRSAFAKDYYHMATAIEVAVEQAFENGALRAPGLKIVVER